MISPEIPAALDNMAIFRTLCGSSSEQSVKFPGWIYRNRPNNQTAIAAMPALGSHAAVIITFTASAGPLSDAAVESWLNASYAPLASVPPWGLVHGVQKCHGLFGAAVAPHAERFEFILILPT